MTLEYGGMLGLLCEDCSELGLVLDIRLVSIVKIVLGLAIGGVTKILNKGDWDRRQIHGGSSD